MICPQCRSSFYFLESRTLAASARCLKCSHRGAPVKFSYDTYHSDLYSSKPYTRNLRTDPQMKWILSRLNIQPRDVVIDLGCGVGDYTREARNLTERAAGYDRDANAAKRKYPGVAFFEHDLDQPIPLPDASVDKLVSINVIEHLVDWDFFLRECHRVLRPGGVIALSTANRDFLLHAFHHDATHYHEWTLDQFVKIAEAHFLTITARKDCAMFNYYPINLILSHVLKPDLSWIGRKKH